MYVKNAFVWKTHALTGKKGFQKGFSRNNVIILSVNFGILKHFITSYMAISQAQKWPWFQGERAVNCHELSAPFVHKFMNNCYLLNICKVFRWWWWDPYQHCRSVRNSKTFLEFFTCSRLYSSRNWEYLQQTSKFKHLQYLLTLYFKAIFGSNLFRILHVFNNLREYYAH